MNTPNGYEWVDVLVSSIFGYGADEKQRVDTELYNRIYSLGMEIAKQAERRSTINPSELK